MPAKPLTPEQKEDAERLRRLFSEHQERLKEQGKLWAQEVMAERLGFGQSALSQYLKAKIPLNASALRAFSTLLGVDPSAISERIASEVRADAAWWVGSKADADGGFKGLAYAAIREWDADGTDAKRAQREFLAGFVAAIESELAKRAAISELSVRNITPTKVGVVGKTETSPSPNENANPDKGVGNDSRSTAPRESHPG